MVGSPPFLFSWLDVRGLFKEVSWFTTCLKQGYRTLRGVEETVK